MAPGALTGILLVGGAGRRFGSPKALASFGGETLAERAWRTLGQACDERIAVGKLADGLVLPFPLLDDGTEARHPGAGIAAGLDAARHDLCVVLPVDCPLLTAAALETLAAACSGGAAAATPVGGPLPGAYRRSAAAAFARSARTGGSLREVAAGLRSVTVELDPALLVNANTPDELARIARHGL